MFIELSEASSRAVHLASRLGSRLTSRKCDERFGAATSGRPCPPNDIQRLFARSPQVGTFGFSRAASRAEPTSHTARHSAGNSNKLPPVRRKAVAGRPLVSERGWREAGEKRSRAGAADQSLPGGGAAAGLSAWTPAGAARPRARRRRGALLLWRRRSADRNWRPAPNRRAGARQPAPPHLSARAVDVFRA
jgi:hypothetical protein